MIMIAIMIMINDQTSNMIIVIMFVVMIIDRFSLIVDHDHYH